ncbi:hypothetical protein M438DRAFT_162385 [Aureobasidium pullulans EXF-150]|uniref:Uncharacterized protein n=1 Tax=Aureobasidium pullulans EXF-150 TaxID=1043002 RepID=A0A074YJT6_AURPU|nr:uncharacterized protein M438DRAFT_162385 [Aureobasidium pullulans EXF-150]KEQ87126.1 hypothetical protein M438DRAFT_162385 [Aureobasidium pullulans EXF-150]
MSDITESGTYMVIELQHMVAPPFLCSKSLCINKKRLRQAIGLRYLHSLVSQVKLQRQCTHKMQSCDTPLQIIRSQVKHCNETKQELVTMFTPDDSSHHFLQDITGHIFSNQWKSVKPLCKGERKVITRERENLVTDMLAIKEVWF